MEYVIISIILIGYILIATSRLTNVNRSAVAIFMGAVGWILYICYGSDFVTAQHPQEYSSFLDGNSPNASNVKLFISQFVFLDYVAKGAELVLFLLATMSIVEILNNNGCFDFLTELLRTRKSKKLLIIISCVTFLISANLDNLTTTTMMLVVMHEILPNRRQRIIYGSAIVISANCGGALTVIGDPTGLFLWSNNCVDASNFSSYLAIPCLLSCILPVLWLGRMLPERIELQNYVLPYRGNDTNLNRWQRLLMLFVGIGGLWFIPTFHNITKLSPFLGALCVLAILWVVNEMFNRKLSDADKMIQRRVPGVLQYGVIQMILYVLGIILTASVANESGILTSLFEFCNKNIDNVWIMGSLSCLLSSVTDSFAASVSFIYLYIGQMSQTMPESEFINTFMTNGIYWKIIAYSTAMGGNIFLFGSLSGFALLKMEHMHIGWFFKNVGWVSILSWFLGLLVLWLLL